MQGAIGSLDVHKKWCIRNWFDHETKFVIGGTKLDIQIATKRPRGSPRTPPCALLENLQADFNCKPIVKLLYRLQWIYRKSISCGRGIAQSMKMRSQNAEFSIEHQRKLEYGVPERRVRSGNANLGCHKTDFIMESHWKHESGVPDSRIHYRSAVKSRIWAARAQSSL